MTDISFWQVVNNNFSAFSDVNVTLWVFVMSGVITYVFQKSNNSRKCKKIEKSLIQKQKEKQKLINTIRSLFNEVKSPVNFHFHKDIQKTTHRR